MRNIYFISYTLICLLLLPLPGIAQEGGKVSKLPWEEADYHPINAELLRLPPDAAVLGELYRAPAQPEGRKIAVFLLQNEHRVYETQVQIHKIIDGLTRNPAEPYLVLLEGGSGQISPWLFRTFPNQEAKEAVLASYALKGELSGGEIAALLSRNSNSYFGIEDASLYAQNRTAFLQVMSAQNNLLSEVKKAQRQVLSLKQQLWPQLLRRLDVQFDNFKKGRMPLAQFIKSTLKPLKKMEIDFSKYPVLKMYIDFYVFEKEFKEGAARELAEQFIWDYKDKVLEKLDTRDRLEFNWQMESYERGIYDRWILAKYLLRKAQELNLDVTKYRELEDTLQLTNDMWQIERDLLGIEIDRMMLDLEKEHLQDEDARVLGEMTRSLALLEKLIRLEAGREEYLRFQAEAERFKSEYYLEFVRKYYLTADFKWDVEPVRGFYELCLQRDGVLFENTRNLLDSHPEINKVILVAGGFHIQGLKQRLREAGYSYAQVFPRQTKAALESVVRDNRAKTLQGRFSFLAEQNPADGHLEPPLALLDPDLRDAFFKRASEEMAVKVLRLEKEMDWPLMQKFLDVWDREYRKVSLVARETDFPDEFYILRLNEIMRKRIQGKNPESEGGMS